MQKMTEGLSKDYQQSAELLAARQGDLLAFKKLYERHKGRVYALCLRLCADKSQAEDAAQEVFIQLWKSLDDYQGDSQFSTWLHSLASNVTISYLRKQKRWWQRMSGLEQSGIEAQFAEENADLSQLEKLLVRLPERTRWVFVLHAIEGYRHEQIAETLNIALGTSKAQFHRARQMIESWLEDNE